MTNGRTYYRSCFVFFIFSKESCFMCIGLGFLNTIIFLVFFLRKVFFAYLGKVVKTTLYFSLYTFFKITNKCFAFRKWILDDDRNTAWKVSKYGVFFGPYFPTFGPNADQKNSIFGHLPRSETIVIQTLFACLDRNTQTKICSSW